MQGRSANSGRSKGRNNSQGSRLTPASDSWLLLYLIRLWFLHQSWEVACKTKNQLCEERVALGEIYLILFIEFGEIHLLEETREKLEGRLGEGQTEEAKRDRVLGKSSWSSVAPWHSPLFHGGHQRSPVQAPWPRPRPPRSHSCSSWCGSVLSFCRQVLLILWDLSTDLFLWKVPDHREIYLSWSPGRHIILTSAPHGCVLCCPCMLVFRIMGWVVQGRSRILPVTRIPGAGLRGLLRASVGSRRASLSATWAESHPRWSLPQACPSEVAARQPEETDALASNLF